MANPTIIYFGASPTTIVMQSSSNFDGTEQTGTPALSPGLYTFPVQVGGGLYDMHEKVGNGDPITILSISYAGGGTLTVKRKLEAANVSFQIGTVSTQGDLTFNPGELTLNEGEQLVFTSATATNPVIAITAVLSAAGWMA